MLLCKSKDVDNVDVPNLGSAVLSSRIKKHYEQRFTYIFTLRLTRGDAEIGSVDALLIGKRALGTEFHAEMELVSCYSCATTS